MDAVERLDMRTEPSRDGDMLKTNSPSELSDFIGKAVQSSAKFEHVQFFASVLEIQGGSYSLIELPDGRSVKVKKAVSCLLTPQVGDLVLVNGAVFVKRVVRYFMPLSSRFDVELADSLMG